MRKMIATMVVVCSGFGCSMMQDQDASVRDGVDGVDGVDGAQGPQGEPGKDGKDGVDGQDANLSGSRLKARYYSLDDGARQMIGFYDMLLDVPCRVRVLSLMDKEARCYPTLVVQGDDWAGFNEDPVRTYTDAQCQVPGIEKEKMDWAGAHFVTAGNDPQTYSIWRTDVEADVKFKLINGVCGPVEAKPGWTLVKVDPEEFVAAQETHD